MSSLDAIKALGVDIKENKEIVKELSENKEDTNKVAKPTFHVKGGDREMAVKLSLVPKVYKDVEFDIDIIKENIIESLKGSSRKFKVKNFKAYTDTLNNIISTIRTGHNIKNSYIIGAPNSFGKTSFANDCIKTLHSQNRMAVPYISLYELAELRVENEKRLLRGIGLQVSKRDEETEEVYYYTPDDKDFIKIPKVITGSYSWSEYVNADILFCYFSSIDSKVIESHTLKCVLEMRGAKGLPTVVFISTSLNPYKLDNALREYVWDEILASKETKCCYDRVYHVSCYKVPNNGIGDNSISID